MKEKSDITILIPTRNRPNFLHLNLSYISNFKIKIFVIIADGSNRVEKKKNLKIISQFKRKIKIQYLYNKNFPWQRNFIASNLIKTKYVKMLADDDFVTEKFLIEAKKILDKNNDFVAVEGNFGFFDLNRDKNLKFFYNNSIEKIQNNYEQRIEALNSKNLDTLIYSLFRKDCYIKIERFVHDNLKFNSKDFYKKFFFGHMAEILFGLLPCIEGKIKKINSIFLIRLVHNEMEGSTEAYKQVNLMNELQKNYKIIHNIDKYIKINYRSYKIDYLYSTIFNRITKKVDVLLKNTFANTNEIKNYSLNKKNRTVASLIFENRIFYNFFISLYYFLKKQFVKKDLKNFNEFFKSKKYILKIK